jgi:uncharacterized repeat protein (TIGR03803 family)
VFEVASGSAAITTLASFNGVNGQVPLGGVSLDASGNIFGTTAGGVPGSGTDYGTVFEIASGSSAVTTLATVRGVQPGVTIDAAGNLYGTDNGTVFEIARGSNAVTTLASFNGANGAEVQGGLMMDAAGNLYGTTQLGGANNDGTVFEIAQGSMTVTTLASLGPAGMNGAVSTDPTGGVTMDSSGNLYGAAMGMPDNPYIGSVFELPKGSAAVTTLASFSLSNGTWPSPGVTLDASGNLYGTTPWGGTNNDGYVFEIARGSTALTTLASFDATNGAGPNGGLMRDASGNLFGTAQAGPNGTGVVFELPKGTSAVTAVASFAASSASGPGGSLTRDAFGDLFGTAGSGGQGYGMVFEIAAGSNVVTTLAAFNAYNIAAGPLSLDASGNLYYTTPGSGFGTVCEIAAGSGAITTLAALKRADGYEPLGGVVIDALGNIYGTTNYGGPDNLGTIFEVARGSTAITTLASFNGTNGAYPGRLIQDASGDLYGAALGALFELPKGSNTITDLPPFADYIALDAAGNLYGAANQGGANGDGTILEIPKGSGTITVLASFSGTDGKGPTGVTPDASGNLFGATLYGGQNGDGTLFEIANGSNAITTLASFNGTDGISPSTLTPDGLGNFYGATYSGGLGASGGDGTVFELTANTTITLTPAGGPNPSNAGQPLGFTVTVTGGVPDGETVSLIDTSNNNAVVASGSLSNGSASLTVPPGTLMSGTHKLIAAYAGDANFAASQSAPVAQTVQVAVTSVAVNGNNSSLAGVQRSMVDSIVYTFSEAVNIAATNAFSIAVDTGQSGIVPSLAWAAINPNSDGSSAQWVVTFSGPGVSGGSIGNGVYDITLNSSAVTSAANPTVTVQARPVDTFYRLFGDINGDGRVNNADYAAFLSTNGLKAGEAGFDAAFDSNGDGRINNSDYALMLTDNGLRYSGFTATI